MFCWQWPEDIQTQVVSFDNPTGTITNSDLEMEGLPLLWLALEETCDSLTEKWITFFGDNSPLISWITRLGS